MQMHTQNKHKEHNSDPSLEMIEEHAGEKKNKVRLRIHSQRIISVIY